MKRLTLKLSALLLAAFLVLSLTISANAESVEALVTGIQKYGNLELDLRGSDFLSTGFAYGDVVTVTLNGAEYEMPVVSNYSDVDNGSMLCRVVIKEETNEDAMLLAINMGDLATTSGIAVKNKIEADPGFEWIYNEGVEQPVKVTIDMKEAGAYHEQYLIHQLSRSEERESYPDLSDEEFANFRMISTTGIGYGTLYRSSSPVNPEISRNAYADAAIEAAGIKTVVNLADSEETMKAYEGFDDSYYAKLNIIGLNLGVDFTAAEFKEGLAAGLRHIAANEGPYLLHCTEGKDRAGFTSAIIEAFMGATLDEIIDDYMTTFHNYYGVEKGSEQYEAVVNSNIIKALQTAFGVEDVSAVDLAAEAEEYLKTELGLTDHPEEKKRNCWLPREEYLKIEPGLTNGEIAALREKLALPAVEGHVVNIQKYGHMDLDIKGSDFLKAYDYGDIVSVSVNGKTYDMPVCNSYTDVDAGEYLVRVVIDPEKERDFISLCINYGQFAADAGVATGAKDADGNTVFTYNEGIEEPVGAAISLRKKGGYYTEWFSRQVTMQYERDAYPDLSDAEFANFREITTAGIAPKTVYRSSSPVNEDISRNLFADAAAREAGIKSVINLADSQESMEAYPTWAESYYGTLNIIPLNLTVNVLGDEFKAGLAEGVRFIAENEGPFLVHCNEGKDRAGFFSAVIEALMGAPADEIVADYMTTYANYYGVEPGTEKYDAIVRSNIAKTLASSFEIEDIADPDVDLAAEAEEYCLEIGLTADEIAAIKEKLQAPSLSTVAPSVEEIDKYGDVRLSVTSGEIRDLGIEYADYVHVAFSGQIVKLPVVPDYRYVEAKGSALVVWEDDAKPVELEIFNGSFAATYGLADKTTNEDKTYFWSAREGVEFPIKVTVSQGEKGGYAGQYLLYDLNRTNERDDYAALTDKEFANFRAVTTTGMGENVLYRASSPVNPKIGRSAFADAAVKEAEIKTIMNQADNEESANAYEGFADTYTASQNVIYLALGADMASDQNRTGFAEGLRFFIANDGPYLIHCNEGQDRTGFSVAILECLMGASEEEVVADYMKTFENFYGVEKGSEQYNAISNNIVKNLKSAFAVNSLDGLDLADAAETYLRGIGLSDDEITALKEKLSAK